MNTELKSCPFFGGKARIYKEGTEQDFFYSEFDILFTFLKN